MRPVLSRCWDVSADGTVDKPMNLQLIVGHSEVSCVLA